MKNILEYIEGSAAAYPDKIAFADTENSITYSGLLNDAKSIGTKLSSIGEKNRPVAVYLDKSIKTLCAMFGVVYSGNFYIIIDSEMPVDRINKIFSVLSPVAIITDDAYLDNAKQLEVD
ncbi:MAG: AMP-binding protein [Eubacterium sp.]|nr:AMP-binding protein [Eubacterium sp.]